MMLISSSVFGPFSVEKRRPVCGSKAKRNVFRRPMAKTALFHGFPAAGAWGRQGCTMIVLAKADAEMVGEALTLAWQRISAATPARKKAAAKKPKKPK